mgnify:CR=1 FL=1
MKWWREADTDARRALMAGMFGWMLDAFDVMLWALVLTDVMAHFGLSPPVAGLLGSGRTETAHLAFGKLGVRWFHTGGIFAALSETTPDVVEEAIRRLLEEAGRRPPPGWAEARSEQASRFVTTPESYLGSARADRWCSPCIPACRRKTSRNSSLWARNPAVT